MEQSSPSRRRRTREARGDLLHIVVSCPRCEERVRLVAGRRGGGPGATGSCSRCRTDLVLSGGELTPVDLSA